MTSNRAAQYDLLILAQWADPALTAAHVAWARAAFEALEQHLEDGVYVNNLGVEGPDRIRSAYGPNYARLAELKRRYDPPTSSVSTRTWCRPRTGSTDETLYCVESRPSTTYPDRRHAVHDRPLVARAVSMSLRARTSCRSTACAHGVVVCDAWHR